nr:MAG TPA: Protein transport protein SEC61, Protein, Sec63, Sec71, Sec72, Sec66.68A [Bacteriophage sp.]
MIVDGCLLIGVFALIVHLVFIPFYIDAYIFST